MELYTGTDRKNLPAGFTEKIIAGGNHGNCFFRIGMIAQIPDLSDDLPVFFIFDQFCIFPTGMRIVIAGYDI